MISFHWKWSLCLIIAGLIALYERMNDRMPKVVIIFASESGNTEKMAKAVAEGASAVKSVQVELYKVGDRFSVSLLNEADAIILGSPTVYGNVAPEMNTFIHSMIELNAAKKLRLKGKMGGIFGSYAFDGGWVVDALAMKMKEIGIRLIPPIVSAIDHQGSMGIYIDHDSLEKCRKLGKTVAARFLKA